MFLYNILVNKKFEATIKCVFSVLSFSISSEQFKLSCKNQVTESDAPPKKEDQLH